MTCEPDRDQIDEDRAAVLLGLTRQQFRQLCQRAGMRHGAASEHRERRLFTYRELYRLCRCLARPAF
jgi:hypothetical protein